MVGERGITRLRGHLVTLMIAIAETGQHHAADGPTDAGDARQRVDDGRRRRLILQDRQGWVAAIHDRRANCRGGDLGERGMAEYLFIHMAILLGQS